MFWQLLVCTCSIVSKERTRIDLLRRMGKYGKTFLYPRGLQLNFLQARKVFYFYFDKMNIATLFVSNHPYMLFELHVFKCTYFLHILLTVQYLELKQYNSRWTIPVQTQADSNTLRFERRFKHRPIQTHSDPNTLRFKHTPILTHSDSYSLSPVLFCTTPIQTRTDSNTSAFLIRSCFF